MRNWTSDFWILCYNALPLRHRNSTASEIYYEVHMTPMRNRTSDFWILCSDALPLSHRNSTVSEVYYVVHMTCILHTARISNVDSLVLNVNRNFVPHSWQDEKHLSLFLYCAQNFPSLLFYLCRITIEKSSSSSTNHIEENCNHYGYY